MVWESTFNYLNRGKVIKKQVRSNDSIIFGGQAIKAQIGFFARPTNDYDILSMQPKKSARQLARTLDKKTGQDNFYTKAALHPGTTKVMHVGSDKIRGTNDDIGIADFSKPRPKFKSNKIEGVNYASLSEIKKDKNASLKSKEFAFRHKKDKDDLNRIKASIRRY